MGYMEKLAAEKKAVKALYDKGMENLTDDEATELKNRFEEAKRLQERVDLFKGVNDLNVDDVKPEAKTAPAAKTLGDLYAQELKKAGMTVIGTKAHPFASSEFKAATDMHVAGTGTAGTGYQPVVTQIDMNGVWPYERPLVVADLFGSVTLRRQRPTPWNYPSMARSRAALEPWAEGGAKPPDPSARPPAGSPTASRRSPPGGRSPTTWPKTSPTSSPKSSHSCFAPALVWRNRANLPFGPSSQAGWTSRRPKPSPK